jgi:hypothetical protein
MRHIKPRAWSCLLLASLRGSDPRRRSPFSAWWRGSATERNCCNHAKWRLFPDGTCTCSPPGHVLSPYRTYLHVLHNPRIRANSLAQAERYLHLSVALAREDRDVDAEHKVILVDVLVALPKRVLIAR